MNLLFFDFVYNLGGAQKSTIDLINNLSHSGYKTIFVDAHGDSENLKGELETNKIQHLVLEKYEKSKLGRGNKFLRLFYSILYFPIYLKIVFKLLKVLKIYKPKLVWTNSKKGLVVLMFIKMFLLFDLVFFIRGEGAIYNKRGIIKFLINKLCKCILVQSEIMKIKAVKHGFNKDKLFEVSNFVNVESSEIIPNNSFIRNDKLNILLPATIIKEKGIFEAVTSVKVLKDKGYQINLILAGGAVNHKNEINFKDFIQNYLDNNNLNDSVKLIGYRSDILNIMQSMDIILLPSYSEGMPRVIMEAMALSKSIIATNVGAIGDLIIDNESGIIIKKKDVDAIVIAVERLMDKNLRDRLSLNALQLISNKYSRNNQLKQFKAIIDL